jgi:hypothetical protein
MWRELWMYCDEEVVEMAIDIKEIDEELGAQEKLVALNIALVIYLHGRRYEEALEYIDELLNDPKMQEHQEYLLFKHNEIRRTLAGLTKKLLFLQFIFDFFHDAD